MRAKSEIKHRRGITLYPTGISRGRAGLGLATVLLTTLVVMLRGTALAHFSNEITQVNPASAAQGTNDLLVTFTLDTDFPPPPPAGDGPQSVFIGSISGTSITHTSQSAVTATFNIPEGEPTGAKDVAIAFAVPGDTLVFSIVGGFTVTSGGSGEEYNIERTLEDGAQRNTIAFDGLAFLTGNLGSQSFLPPGKVADFSGFQYLRDNDATNLGHNTSFVTVVALNVLHLLTAEQVDLLVDRAQTQIDLINEYAYERFPLIQAFRRLLEGDVPAGSAGLDKSAVMAYSASLYWIDGQISYDRAQLLGGIVRSLTAGQRASLDSLKALGGVGYWDDSLPDPLQPLQLPQDVNVAVMTYASEMYSWYSGSVEADTYFCPERQGTYFGSFYLKDWPAMGNPDYTIDEQLTAQAGEIFLQSLDSGQAQAVTGLVDIQRDDLYEIVATREAISTLLRQFMTQESIDSAAVMELAEQYGELDGEIVYYYATHFATAGQTLSTGQQEVLTGLVDSLGYLPPAGAFLYSAPIDMPEIMNTDFLFRSSDTCGDIDGNGAGPDIADLVYLVAYMFSQGPEPPVMEACDVDGSGSGPDIADLVYLVTYMFGGGPDLQCP